MTDKEALEVINDVLITGLIFQLLEKSGVQQDLIKH